MREERVEPVGQGVTNAARPQPSRPAAPEVSARSSSENTAAFAEVVGPEPAPEKEIVPRHAGSSISRGSPSVPSARGADGEGADSLSEQVATYRRALGMPNREAALGEWREMLKRWPSTTLRHEIELNIVDALARLGRREEARGAASTFLKHFPSSPRAGDMKKLLAGDTPKH
jgi:hypothetical protein